MNSVLTNIAVLICSFALPAAGANAIERKPYEMPRTEVIPIEESGTDRQYELFIKLPEDYEENTDTVYPVIYTTDAVVHMDMLSGATEFLMPEVIVVGISYQTNHPLADERANISRFRDYITVEHTDPEIQARFQPGQAANHLSFIRDEIIPHIESNYRADSSERTYFGYSLGGAFGAYILLSHPDTFRHYILGSPAFSNDTLQYIDELEAASGDWQDTGSVNAFVSLGELEEDAVEDVNRFLQVLRRRDQSSLALSGLEIIEDADHAGAFPETTIRGVKWLTKLQPPDAPEGRP